MRGWSAKGETHRKPGGAGGGLREARGIWPESAQNPNSRRPHCLLAVLKALNPTRLSEPSQKPLELSSIPFHR